MRRNHASVPPIRVTAANIQPLRQDGEFILYWMIAARRARWNFGLQRAAELATELRRPLVVLEALNCDYRWNSDRIHRFILDGMADNARQFARSPVHYYPYVEPQRRVGHGLLRALSQRACAVVTDEFPCFFLPRIVAAAAATIPARLEAVDSNGLLPLRAATTTYPTAYAFRRFLQREVPNHLAEFPAEDPLKGRALPRLPDGSLREIERCWPRADERLLSGSDPAALTTLPIDHGVPVAPQRGGALTAAKLVDQFLDEKLSRYPDERNEPSADASSGFSSYLHFGYLSIHAVLAGLAEREKWSPAALAKTVAGKREGWWNMSPAAEAFLDEAVTWRELGYNYCHLRPDDYDAYESLPDWARRTLDLHATDKRKFVYVLDEFAQARTHDALWNAAQRQLLREGRMHNYLRMLWGKKILEWSPTPRDALAIMIELNNRYALDGRNPNSYTGIFWVLGRFDRPWAPERPIFGTIRYMSSENTARKFDVKPYLERYGESLFA